MKSFEIVAHRGVCDIFPENTISALERAIELGADSIELDVRLSSDRIPVVFHYFYLNDITSATGTIFDHTYEELRSVNVIGKNGPDKYQIPALTDVLEVIGGRIGLEIEIKGPEPESPRIIAEKLSTHRSIWNKLEVTSYEPLLLRQFQMECPAVPTDLLFPRSEPWMKLDVVSYLAIHNAKMAGARAVHLHPTQLTYELADKVRKNDIEIHAWDVNDEQSLKTCVELEISRICTDNFQQARNFRQNWMMAN